MRDTHQRLFIALDEWLGVLIAIFLYERGSNLFWWFLIPWAVAVYVISYPWYWWERRKRERTVDEGTSTVIGSST